MINNKEIYWKHFYYKNKFSELTKYESKIAYKYMFMLTCFYVKNHLGWILEPMKDKLFSLFRVNQYFDFKIVNSENVASNK